MRRVQPLLAWGLVAAGALLLLLGWYGVSGESLTAKQLPYLVSGGLGGIALIVVAASLLTTQDVHRQLARLEQVEQRVTTMYELLVEELVPAALDAAELVRVAGGSTYHRPTCPLVVGKETSPLGPADRLALTPCDVCAPAAA
ncbi:MAG: hypothetical protein JWL79_2324 [Frankiales bacterium]|nr:hypothetical protein [Frankiales bacterium]